MSIRGVYRNAKDYSILYEEPNRSRRGKRVSRSLPYHRHIESVEPQCLPPPEVAAPGDKGVSIGALPLHFISGESRVTPKATMGDTSSEDMLALPVWDFKPETQTAETSGQGENKSSESNQTPDAPKATPQEEANPKETPKPAVEPKKQDDEARQPSEPPTRGKSKYDFIIERKQRQLEKMKQEKLSQLDKDITDNGGDPSSDMTVDPSDEDTITKVIDKKMGAQLEYIERQKFENEVSQFLSGHELNKFLTSQEIGKFKEYASHPSRAQVPFDELLDSAIGSKRLIQI